MNQSVVNLNCVIVYLLHKRNMGLVYYRGAQPFWAKGHSVLLLSYSRAEDKILIWTFESEVSKIKTYLTSLFDACGFI